uniref:Uncharacterized protein n=1 Tax=Helianthus annuus TaxID=4232 RepID=A0A251SF64_HELAN
MKALAKASSSIGVHLIAFGFDAVGFQAQSPHRLRVRIGSRSVEVERGVWEVPSTPHHHLLKSLILGDLSELVWRLLE